MIRGYENGKHITHREEWKPTLFVPSKRKTKYKTLEGDSVEPIQPGFVRDCREFYKKYDEVHLLRSFLAYWRKNLPEVITGWNSQMYDIPYLAGRINRILGEKSMKDLSPWGLVSQDEVYISGRKNITYDIGGVTQLDYLDLYKRQNINLSLRYKTPRRKIFH